MPQVFAFALMLGVAFWHASPVEACSCVVPSTEQAFKTSDLVVSGRVVKIELVSTGLIRVELAVEQMFKGGSQKSMLVFTRPRAASCYEYDFRAGERYLIFAIQPATRAPHLMLSDLPGGEYITGACLGTEDLATTQGLNRLRATQHGIYSPEINRRLP